MRFEEASRSRPARTPTFADGRISRWCDGKAELPERRDRRVIWSHDVMTDAGVAPADMPQWGYSSSPLVVDGLVVVFAGGAHDKSVLAYQATDGKPAWAAPLASSPIALHSSLRSTVNGKS